MDRTDNHLLSRTTSTGPLCGPPAPLRRGRARLMGDALLYAAPHLDSRSTRHAASILAALDGQALTVQTPEGAVSGALLVVRPLVEKHVLAPATPVLLIDLEPNHPDYRAFRGVGAPAGVCALDPQRHPQLQRLARAFCHGHLQGPALDDLARSAVERVAAEFPPPAPMDIRLRQMMTLMDEHPRSTLCRVARQVGLSPHRASQLFSQGLGLPWRRYSLSSKIRRAAQFMGSGQRLTDVAQAAGFVDSAHFAKVWVQTYGASPSHFFPSQCTEMDGQGLPDWVGWHLARRAPGLMPLPADAAHMYRGT